MEIEVGKFYKTRTGLKVRIYALDGSGDTTIHGAVFNAFWFPQTWNYDGSFYSDETRSEWDIISEWSEPKPKLKAYMNKGGTIFLLPPNAKTHATDIRCPWLDEPEEK